MRRLARLFRRAFRYLYLGPVGLSDVLQLEWRFVAFRWLAIILVLPGVTIAHFDSDVTRWIYTILSVGAAYNLSLHFLIPLRPQYFRSGYVTSFIDGLLNLVMVSLGGGFASPWYYVLFIIVISTAMRFGYGPATGITFLYITFDIIESDILSGITSAFIFRSSFLLVTAILASYLRQQAANAQATLASQKNDLLHAYADLERAHRELLRADEMKTDFLANVSHELRTPLTSIRSFTEMLLSYGDHDPEVRREFLGIISSESERLTRLINDVLDITKIESGNWDWRMAKLDLSALAGEIARAHLSLIKTGDVILQQDIAAGLPPVFGDRDRLQQVLSNLLSNAFKFTPSGAIKLSVQRVGDEIHVSVQDTGIGIAAEDHERIFDKFQQVGRVLTNKPAGTGLGLAICRIIIAHHNGRIWVESQPGMGSTFTFSLPLLPASAGFQGFRTHSDHNSREKDGYGVPLIP